MAATAEARGKEGFIMVEIVRSVKKHQVSRRVPRPRVCVLALIGLLFALPMPAQEGSPWELLEGLRNHLQAAGPTTAAFVQTYVPAGFSSGDEESGHLSIWLPDCLRWSYEKPQVKHFLVCQSEVFFWNDEEPGGRRSRVNPAEETGLDLLLVSVETLRQRYIAEASKLEDGGYRINLALPSETEGLFRATLELDPSWKRVRQLEYTDDEGNLTRFRMAEYQPLRHTALFTPPGDIEWTEE